MKDDQNLVSDEIIRQIMLEEVSATDIVKRVVSIEKDEPALFSAMTEMLRSISRSLADEYPLIKNDQPRIFSDVAGIGQNLFIRGFLIGKATMRSQIDDFFSDVNAYRKPLLPEEDLRNFD